MKTHAGSKNYKLLGKGTVLTIGNFDGVHLGHRELILTTASKAEQLGLASVVYTFDRHPSKVLSTTSAVARLFSQVDLSVELNKLGVQDLVVEPFTPEFAQLTAQQFAEKILVNNLKARHIVVGHDFMFGQNREGDFEYLQTIGRKNNFTVEKIAPVLCEGQIVSSTLIRNLLLTGEVEKVQKLLLRKFYIEGFKVAGEGRGKKMGFPTINMKSTSEIIPCNGVYITEVMIDKMRYPALTNIGTKPTFHDNYELSIESYLLDNPQVSLSDEVRVYFCKRLRSELKFPSIHELIKQIGQDIENGKKYFEL